MLPALQHIINKDQRGFMKERRISVNIRKMLDIMHYADHEDLEAIVLSLDFVKCFDKCSFSILHGSLDFFNFGEIVKQWTKILYKGFTVRIQNNGNFSQKIDIKKGVHQGGCCSSVYFLVIAELLALSIRHNNEIDGITIGQIKHLLNQFADDMDTFSICNEKSIRAIHSELENFREHSGFTVSYDKTTIYRIGSLKHSDSSMYSIEQYKWSNKDINVLGVTISHQDILQKNYDDIVKKVNSTLNAWYNRGLTLTGKVQVVNTLIASLFVYKMMVLPKIPDHIVKNVYNSIRNFIWNGKKAKIALSILQNPKDQGGLNLVNLRTKDTALKATWPLILHTESEYASLVYVNMRCTGIQEDIWRCTLLPEHVPMLGMHSTFWSDVLGSWNQYNFLHEFRIENQLIWYNSYIQVAGKPFFWKDIYDKGLIYVHQLFKDQQFREYDDLYRTFGLTSLRYNTLKAAIPSSWKIFFKESNKLQYMPLPLHNYDRAINGLRTYLEKYIDI